MSASARALVLVPSTLDCDADPLLPEGLRVGNRPAALPPGLSVEPEPLRKGRFPTGSGVVTDEGGMVVVVELIPGDGVTEAEADGEADAEAEAGVDGLDFGGAVTDTVTEA